jgi:hypothetical protein
MYLIRLLHLRDAGGDAAAATQELARFSRMRPYFPQVLMALLLETVDPAAPALAPEPVPLPILASPTGQLEALLYAREMLDFVYSVRRLALREAPLGDMLAPLTEEEKTARPEIVGALGASGIDVHTLRLDKLISLADEALVHYSALAYLRAGGHA